MKPVKSEKIIPDVVDSQQCALGQYSINRRTALLLAAAAVGASFGRWTPPTHAAPAGKLEILSWDGFTLEKENQAWREKNGLDQRSTLITNQDDVTIKLASGGLVRIDATVCANGYEEIYRDLGVLTELDMKRIPNYNKDDIFAPFYQQAPGYFDGKQWVVPYCWGFDTIVQRPDIVGAESTSLEDLLRPEFNGKLTIVDNPMAAWPQFAKISGYGDKYPNMTKSEVLETFKNMEPYKRQCRVFASTNGDAISLFAAGEIAGCFNG